MEASAKRREPSRIPARLACCMKPCQAASGASPRQATVTPRPAARADATQANVAGAGVA